MKEETRWKVIAGIVLVTLTLLLMTVHYLIFQDSRYLFTYLLADLAFIPTRGTSFWMRSGTYPFRPR